MSKMRDKLWLWGHEAGSHNNKGFGLPRDSRMTPSEAAYYLGIPNLIMVCYGGKPEPPFDQYATALSPLERVIWSIVGDSSSTRNNQQSDLEEVVSLAGKFKNIKGAIMDDFFHPPDENQSVSRYNLDVLMRFRDELHSAKLPLWVVLYQHELNLPVQEYLKKCDGVTYWTWKAEQLENLENDFKKFSEMASGNRKMLGCYMWDYGNGKPMPLPLMEKQCNLGLRWLKEGRIEGIIFLASCICDLDLEAVEWTRRWIQTMENAHD